MDAHERRIRSLEKTIPNVRGGGFQGLIQPVDPPLDDNDQRLKAGVTEFEYVFPPGSIDPGRKEKRGLGFISPWCSVEFCDGGNRTQWNLALKELRQNDKFFAGHGVVSSLSFDGDGKLQQGGILFIRFQAPNEAPNRSRWWRPQPEAR
jgi:hypothetical protein